MVVAQVTHSFFLKSTPAVFQSTNVPAKDFFCGDIPNALLLEMWTAIILQLDFPESKVGRSGDMSRRRIFSFIRLRKADLWSTDQAKLWEHLGPEYAHAPNPERSVAQSSS